MVYGAVQPGSEAGKASAADGEPGGRPRVGYLGPAGTFSEAALLASAQPQAVEPVALASIHEAIDAVRDGAVRWAVVPIENSLDGSVTITLDLLAVPQGGVEIVGEALLPVRHALIAAEPVALDQIETVVSHPQVPGQCTRLLRGALAHARVLPASSTAEAVRLLVAERTPGRAALGPRLAAEIYGAAVLREGVQDRDDNVTRFVWLARTRTAGDPGSRACLLAAPLRETRGEGGWKTSVVFWGAGADSPGWLMRCLDEFARRAINLTKIESRPQRGDLGHYMFFVDLQGSTADPAVAAALGGLRAACEHVGLLGSYQAASGILGA